MQQHQRRRPHSQTGLDDDHDDADRAGRGPSNAPAVFLELAILENGSEVFSDSPELGLHIGAEYINGASASASVLQIGVPVPDAAADCRGT